MPRVHAPFQSQGWKLRSIAYLFSVIFSPGSLAIDIISFCHCSMPSGSSSPVLMKFSMAVWTLVPHSVWTVGGSTTSRLTLVW